MKKFFLIPLMACLVCLYAGAQNVAKIGNTEYATINAAFEAAGNGATIQMIADADFQQPIKLNVNEDESTHKAYTLDLNGKMLTFNPTGTADKAAQRTSIFLYGGILNIVNSVPGVGGITNNTGTASSTQVIMVHGTYKKTVDPKTEEDINKLFTYLNVADGVNFYTTGIGVTVDGIGDPVKDADNNVINKGTKIYKYDWINEKGQYITGATKSAAFGVRVDIRGSIEATKYGVKANGDLAFPDPEYRGGWTQQQIADSVHKASYGPGYYFTKGEDSDKTSSIRYKFYGNNTDTISTTDAKYTPYIHIFPSAVIKAGNSKKNTAAYCSGYARWLIEGACAAANGVYVRSGEVVLNDAVVESTYKDDATVGTTGSSGINGAGWAIIAESKNNYAGETSLTIQGDTKATTEADGGAALKETVEAKSENSNITAIAINGGTFSGDQSINISTQTADQDKVTVYGSTLNGEIVAGNESDIEALLPEGANIHTTVVENEDGKPTVIISDGSAPETPGLTPEEVLAGETNSWADIADQSDLNNRKNVAWTGIDAVKGVGTIASNEKIYLGELQMIKGTEANKQTLTINSGGELNVSQLILNKNARIIVKPGAKLIVVGDQGMHAPDSSNIVLETSDTQPAYFMFHPNVTSNRHPQAQIQFSSRGYQKPRIDGDPEGGKYQQQRFGVPSWKPVPLSCIISRPARSQYQRVVNDDPSNYNMWEMLTSLEDLLVPFTSYAMTCQASVPGGVYTFACEIVGNGDAVLNLYEKYNYFSNSYTAPIDIKQVLADFKVKYPHIHATIYLHNPDENWWYEINTAKYRFHPEYPTKIEPMQAFIFVRSAAGTNPVIDYNNYIWTPIMESGSTGAPARAQDESFGTARIEIVAADGSTDEVCLMEGSEFSAAFDNSYDAIKFMNQDKKTFIYANGSTDMMGMLATDNLEGTTFSMTTTDQTSFMMRFDHVNGVNYAIRDMLTGTETEIAEGATYMFSVPADATIENRFQIVKVKKVPTAIENTIEENTSKGIYTMTGLYVGNDFHSLPAGVYVVDGKKIVK